MDEICSHCHIYHSRSHCSTEDRHHTAVHCNSHRLQNGGETWAHYTCDLQMFKSQNRLQHIWNPKVLLPKLIWSNRKKFLNPTFIIIIKWSLPLYGLVRVVWWWRVAIVVVVVITAHRTTRLTFIVFARFWPNRLLKEIYPVYSQYFARQLWLIHPESNVTEATKPQTSCNTYRTFSFWYFKPGGSKVILRTLVVSHQLSLVMVTVDSAPNK